MKKAIYRPQVLEVQALSISQTLNKQKLSYKLKPNDAWLVKEVIAALKAGQKGKLLKIAHLLYEESLQEERINAAMNKVIQLSESLPQQRLGGEFPIVMEHLKERYKLKPEIPAMEKLEEALLIMVMSLLHSDRNAIFYKRFDPETEQYRPTTFPLTLEVVKKFLSPFHGQENFDLEEFLKATVFVKGRVVMANPACWLTQQYKINKAEFDAKQKAESLPQESEKSNARTPKKSNTDKILKNKEQAVRIVSEELLAILETPNSQDEKLAVKDSLMPDNFFDLLEMETGSNTLILTPEQKKTATAQPGEDFSKRLEKIYSARLSPLQAKMLSARLASRMKRVLQSMGNWDEKYWAMFQSLMQENDVWEGQEWLDKWRSHKSGKKHLKKDYATAEVPYDPLADMLDKSNKQRDKQRGKHMLEAAITPEWLQTGEYTPSREERKVLHWLGRSDHFVDLINVSLPQSDWSSMPKLLQRLFLEGFYILSETDMDNIKTQILEQCPPEFLEEARKIMAFLELSFQQLTQFARQDHQLSFDVAIKYLQDRAEMSKRAQDKNENFPAASYAKYQQQNLA